MFTNPVHVPLSPIKRPAGEGALGNLRGHTGPGLGIVGVCYEDQGLPGGADRTLHLPARNHLVCVFHKHTYICVCLCVCLDISCFRGRILLLRAGYTNQMVSHLHCIELTPWSSKNDRSGKERKCGEDTHSFNREMLWVGTCYARATINS